MARPLLARIESVLNTAVIAGAFATIPLTLLLEEGRRGAWIQAADWLVWSIFLAEFAFRVVWRKVGYRQALFLAAVVVLSFPLLPTLLGLVRIVRLSRVLRLVRVVGATAWGIEGLRAVLGRKSVIHVGAISILVIVASGGGIALLEPQTVHGGFQDGLWWAIVTASTVGYGDIAPTTLLGRAIAVVLMLTGVGLISTLAASITTHFLGQQEDSELAAIRLQLARIEGLVNQLQAKQAAESAESIELKMDSK
jgi:voltage-gated potassium channel